MAVQDPVKSAKAMIRVNAIGAVIGGIGGIYLTKKFLPMSGVPTIILATIGGAVGGAYAQSKMKAFSGKNKSNNTLK